MNLEDMQQVYLIFLSYLTAARQPAGVLQHQQTAPDKALPAKQHLVVGTGPLGYTHSAA
jgi:hypothetical protein